MIAAFSSAPGPNPAYYKRMVAWFTRLLVVTQVIAATTFAYATHRWLEISITGSALIGFCIVLLVRMAIVGNNFRIARRYWEKNKWVSDLDTFAVLRMFLRECFASMRMSTWTMPFARKTWSNNQSTEELPVVLVHGYACNSGYWHAMRRALTSAGIQHDAVDLEPIFGDIEDYLPQLDRLVDRATHAAYGKPVVVVGHSMGGLVARAYLRCYGADRIARIITIGTPHNGTILANYSAGSNCRQMRHDAASGRCSEWLDSLGKSHAGQERQLITSIYSRHDNIIAPQASCHLSGGKNLAFDGIGHVELGCHPLVHASVISEVKEAGIEATKRTNAASSTASR